MISDVQKANRVGASTSLLCLFNENLSGFISEFLTVNETWIHHFDPESKVHRMALKHASSPPPRKFRVLASARKVMATVFWDAEGIVVIDYLVHGSTITGTYYADLIGQVRAALKEERRGKLRRGVLFHQHLLTHHLKHWLPFEVPDSICSFTHRIRQTWLRVTSICFLS